MYLWLLPLSLFSCVIGWALEITAGNISHTQHGRIANAGAVLFPNLPFVPLCYIGVAWAIDLYSKGMGWLFVASYAGISIICRIALLRAAMLKLRRLQRHTAKLDAN